MSSDSEHVKKKESREERLRKVQSLCSSIQSEQRKRTVTEGGITMATPAKKGKGQRSTYKIKLGWQNFREGKYRVVTKAKGGESRMMHYTFGETLTVERIRNQALAYFFPDGVSNMGSVEEYDFSLALTSGQVIDSFIDKNKNQCNFSEFLKANGLYASQCHIYLRSKKKENKSFVINGVPIEKGDRTINIKYSKILHSRYSEEQSELSCQSTLRCFDVSGSPEKELDTYDPFDDGFLVSRIEVQNTVFLEKDGNVFNCPEASEQFILNGPNQIFGLEVDDSNSLVLGAVTLAHNNNNYIYKWLRNGNLFCSGINHCVVKVTEPGNYHVTVENSDDSSTQGISDIVNVDVISSANTGIMNKGALLQTIQPATHSQVINPGVDSQIAQPATHSQATNPGVDTSTHIAHEATHSQATNPGVDTQIAQPATHSQATNPGVDTSTHIAHEATHSQATNPGVDTQIAQPATHSQAINPGVDTQIVHKATHSQVINPGVDTQIVHKATHSQVINPGVDTQIVHKTTHSQVINPGVDTSTLIAHVATHSQVINPGVDTQIAHEATHSQATNPGVDTQIVHKATHSQVINPGVDTQIVHKATHSQVINPGVDTQIVHKATHSQVINPGVDTQIVHKATHSQVINPGVDTQIVHKATHSQVINPGVDTQIAHEATHSQATNPGVDTSTLIAHVATHSQVINPGVDTQISHEATHSQVINPGVDPKIAHVDTEFDHASKQSEIIIPVVDPQIEHSAQLKVVRKPAERQTYSNSTANLNCVPLIQLTDIAIGRELGQGGFRTVFEGEWLKSKVAVKVISVKRLKIYKSNLLREITVHSQLRHPNIVLLMAYALESSKLYLITELVEGGTLDEVLFGDNNKTLIMSERLAIAEKICLAVVYLHSQTPVVIHRDIKPENILISHDLKQVKLCDMGLSKIKTMNTVMTTMAGGLVQPGTPVYKAPEILVDRKSSNIASDMWSLSCTLVELMGDCPIWNMPDDSDNQVQYIMEQMNVNAKPDGFHELRSVVGTKVYCVLERGLSYKSTDRPQASEMVDCLRTLIMT